MIINPTSQNINNSDISLDIINNYDMDTSPLDEPSNSFTSHVPSLSPLCWAASGRDDNEFNKISGNFPFSGFGQPYIESGDGPRSTYMFNIEMQNKLILSCPTTPPNHDADPSTHNTPQHQNNVSAAGAGKPELVFEDLEPAAEVLESSSPHWFWQIVLLLITYLHLHFHLPH